MPATFTAPFFLIDVAALFPELFVLGDSILGGPDVLGSYELQSVSVANDFFPPLPRVIVTTVGLTTSPTTGSLAAICGQVFAFVAGSQVQFNCITTGGTTFSLDAVYSGATNVFIGSDESGFATT